MTTKKKKLNKSILRNGNLFCTACGREQVMPYPLSVSMFSVMAKQFDKEHKHCEQTYTAPIVDMKLSRREREEWWLRNGEHGMSSESIFANLSSIKFSGPVTSYPHDSSDFGRCYALLQIVPEFKTEFKNMRKASPMWSKFVDNWDKLTDMYETSLKTGKAPGMYELIKEIES